MNKPSLAVARAAARLGLIALFSAGVAAAQTTSSAGAASSQPQVLEKFEVTGSYIPYSAEAPAVPVTKIPALEIENTGETDLLEVLRKTVPQFVGNGNVGSSNSSIAGGSTNGGSRIQLRNVDTLVLINGRRGVFAPVSATGGFDFVDVNSIPVSAVESIEVLKDGASALYGSDAVSGVVNIILKKDFQGVEIGGRYRIADGNWEERSARVIMGATQGNTSLTLSFEWLKADPIFQNEREFSFDQTGKTSAFPGVLTLFGFTGSRFPGTYLLAEGKTPPLNADLTAEQLVAQGIYLKDGTPTFASQFNISRFVTLALGNERRGVTLAATHKLGDKVELFGDMMYSQTSTFLQLAAQPIFGMPLTAKNVTDYEIGVGITNANHPTNPFNDHAYVRNRFVDFPRRYFNDTNTLRGMVGIRGEFAENSRWELAANLNRADQDYRNENVIDRVALSNAIDAGHVNMFARVQDPGRLAQANIFGTAFSRNESTLNSFDGRVVGLTRYELPGGPIGFAVGVESRRETLSAEPDKGSYTILDPDHPQFGAPSSWDGATTTDPLDVDRYVLSSFAEIRVPLVGSRQNIRGAHLLDLDLAAREDRYSDADDPLVPKASLRWMPVDDQFVVRATYSESFSAPSLYDLYGPTGVGFTSQIVDLKFLDGRVVDLDQAHSRGLTSKPAVSQGFSSKLLEPEESENFNFGFVYSPRRIRGLSIEANYFRIEQDKITGSVDEFDILQDIELEGAASKYASRVRFGGFNGTPVNATGLVSRTWAQFQSISPIYVSNFSENFVAATQDGVDLTVRYNFELQSLGRFNVMLTGMWFNKFTVDGGDGDVDEYVGTTNGRDALNGGTIPRWNVNMFTNFTRGNWRAGLGVFYIPSVVDTTASATQRLVTRDRNVESFTRADGYIGYSFRGGSGVLSRFDGLQVRIGASNIFDEQPPQAASSWTDHNSDTATYGTFGRVLYIDASVKF